MDKRAAFARRARSRGAAPSQPIQWSSEYSDTELGLVYYNYCHYNPADGRWTGRDTLGETSGSNLYGFLSQAPYALCDALGMSDFTVEDAGASISGFAVGYELYIRNKTLIKLDNEPFYLEYRRFSQGRKSPKPKKGKLWISRAKDGRLYHLDLEHSGMNKPHHNVYKGIEKVKGLHVENHSDVGAKALGGTITVFKYAGRACFAVAAVASAYEIYRADDKVREVTRQVSGWAAASAGALYGAKAGTYVGAAIGAGAAGAGAIPGSVVGGFVGGLVGGAVGWWVGTSISEVLYDWVFSSLEKEEYHLVCAE